MGGIFGLQIITMKSLFSICVILLSFAIVGCKAQTATTPTYDLTVKEFDKLSKETPDAVIADVRSPVDYVEGYIPNAVNIDYTGKYWTQVIANIDKTKPYFLYCLGGNRSAEAAEVLRKEGFAKVYVLQGGYTAWQAAGMPTATHNVNLRDKQ